MPVTASPFHPLVLASGSPRRRQLLEMLGLPFRVVLPGVDETYRNGEAPEAYVVRLAPEKATAVAAREPGELVRGADTTVVVRGALLRTPSSPDEAAAMLARLQ